MSLDLFELVYKCYFNALILLILINFLLKNRTSWIYTFLPKVSIDIAEFIGRVMKQINNFDLHYYIDDVIKNF